MTKESFSWFWDAAVLYLLTSTKRLPTVPRAKIQWHSTVAACPEQAFLTCPLLMPQLGDHLTLPTDPTLLQFPTILLESELHIIRLNKLNFA